MLSEDLLEKIGEKLLELSIIPDKKVLKCYLLPDEAVGGNATIEVDTEEDIYVVVLSLSPDTIGENYPVLCFKEDSVEVVIKSITIRGYNLYFPQKLEDINFNVDRLKSILRSLATSHSRSVEFGASNPNKESYNHTLITEDFTRILSVIQEVIERKFKRDIDVEVFRVGVYKLCSSSKNIFKIKNTDVLVRSYIPKSRVFLKDSDNEKCKIINFVPYKKVPLVYDLLLAIFYFSTEEMRQYYFYEFLDYYFEKLEEKLSQTGYKISNILSYSTYQKLVYTYTPFAKLEAALVNLTKNLATKTLKGSKPADNILSLIEDNKLYNNLFWIYTMEIYDIVSHPNLSKEDCFKIIKNKTGSNKFQILNWKLESLENRSGYLGDYYKLTINIKQDGHKKSLNLFAKYIPSYNEALLDIARPGFTKEIFFYTSFIQQANNLGLNDITDFLPQCYLAIPDTFIMFEDMSLQGYKSVGQYDTLSYKSSLLVVKQLAKLHACSLLYEEILTEKFGKVYRIDDNFGEFLEEILLSTKEGGAAKPLVCGIEGMLKYLMDAFPDIPKKFSMDKFKEKVKNLYDKMTSIDLKSNEFRNVICQGDIWGNNILFKKNKNEELTGSCIVDFQLIRYCPPTHDLLFFIYLNTSRETRKKHMDEILRDYYLEMSQIFKKHSFDFSKLYTYSEFLKCCDTIRPMAISLASVYAQTTMYPDEKLQQLIKNQEKFTYVFTIDRKEVIDELYDHEEYRKRLRELVEDLYEICESS